MLVAAARVTVWKSNLVTIFKTNEKEGFGKVAQMHVTVQMRDTSGKQGFYVVLMLIRIYKTIYFSYILMQRYRNPTEESAEMFKKHTSAALFSDYQTLANNTPGSEENCSRRQPKCLFLRSLQTMCL